MGSSEKGRSDRRITIPWCGSRVAGRRVTAAAAAGKTTILLDVTTSLASEASLVLPVRKWNAMVPRMDMAMILRKLDTNVTSMTGPESIDGVRG